MVNVKNLWTKYALNHQKKNASLDQLWAVMSVIQELTAPTGITDTVFPL